MTKDEDVVVAQKETVYDGYFQVERYRLSHRLHKGGMSEQIMREVFERGHAVAVLPFDPINDVVVLQEQFRVGAYAAGQNPWLTEIVAGIIEDGETNEQVAMRETKEEAGLEALELWPMVRYLASPGGTSETVEIFLARVDRPKEEGVFGLDHENEDIRVFPLPFLDAMTLLKDGKINNSMTLIALQWLALNHKAVLARWRP
jgi:ADP-ribose pyrophosphatase